MTGPTATPDVDELATSVRADPSGPNLLRFWQAVYGLQHWWLLPTTTDADDPRPMIGMVEQRSFLLAFTSDRHVKDFSRRHRGTEDRDGIATMSITPVDMTALAPTLIRQGLAGLLFDQGVHNIVAPIAGLESMLSEFGGHTATTGAAGRIDGGQTLSEPPTDGR